VRVYLPATMPLLRAWLAAGEAAPAAARDLGAHAVTPTLREWYHDADLDELEHAAQVDASVTSLRLIALDPSAARRRVVIAVDVDDQVVGPDSEQGRAAVRVSGPVPVTRWASALVDDPVAQPVVEVAVAALGAADAGDDDARFAIDEAEATELGWYAVQELRHLTD
jgi:hypothetical protein